MHGHVWQHNCQMSLLCLKVTQGVLRSCTMPPPPVMSKFRLKPAKAAPWHAMVAAGRH
jgi:hypothetical protein